MKHETRQLNVFCEGQTEQGFCKRVLQEHLFPGGDGIIHTLPTGERKHHHVYGIRKYGGIRKHIVNSIRRGSGRNAFFTTMFDLYALPNDFPGKGAHPRNPADPTPYVLALEKAWEADISNHRFVPYLQLHEYETLLFADPTKFADFFEDCATAIAQLVSIADSVPTIEHINDGKHTAPSKRIISSIPEYEGRKSSVGPEIAKKITIPVLRQKCPHFDSWITRLESLPWESQ